MRKKFVETAKEHLGIRGGSAQHKALIDLYNSQKTLPRGYRLKYTDAWCAGFVSVMAIKCGLTDIIPVEVSCTQMIALAKKLGIWQERDNYKPQPGDLIIYDWQDSGRGDNTGAPDHIGIVETCNGKDITVIEGNYNNAVGRRPLAVNGKYIRGYICPKFAVVASTSTSAKSIDEIAREVIAGKWGNGNTRKKKLTAAGYDATAVQARVNQLAGKALKSIDEIAKEVIRGDWGNGEERKKRLTAAGYDAAAVQTTVNKLASNKQK